MPFTADVLADVRVLASRVVWDAWHDQDNPPRIYCQTRPVMDPVADPGDDVTDDFTAHYDPERGTWTFHAKRLTMSTHAVTHAYCLAATRGPGNPEILRPGEHLTFTWSGTRDDCVTVTG